MNLQSFITTGIERLTYSRRNFLKKVRYLEYLTIRRNWDDVLSEMDDLINLARSYFAEEEQLMSLCGLDVVLHAVAHYNLVEALYSFRDMCLKQSSEEMLKLKFNMICDDIASHAKTLDQSLAALGVKL